MKILDWLFKDATASSVHATTAIGNSRRDKKRREFDATIADDSQTDADDAMSDNVDKFTVMKVDSELGLVFGFAIVCKRDGENYFDLQQDHITEPAMLKAAADFMVNSRISKDMHEGEADGAVVFAFPMTTEIAKALDITTKQTGLLIAMKPSADVLAKFKDGTYTGFSIGGSRVKDEDVD